MRDDKFSESGSESDMVGYSNQKTNREHGGKAKANAASLKSKNDDPKDWLFSESSSDAGSMGNTKRTSAQALRRKR